MPSPATSCTICRQPVGNSWFVSDIGDVFCTSHTNPRFCQGCRRTLPQQTSGDFCGTCHATLYSHVSQTTGSQRDVLGWLNGHIGHNGLHNVPVALEEPHNFAPQQTGVTNWVYDGQNFDVGIRILRNVTPNTFEGTLAHEYGHVMLVVDPDSMRFRGGFPDHRHVEEEGFCEVMKYLWLQERGTGNRQQDQLAIRNNPDPVYGDGFRMIWKEYERLGSIPALRAHMLGLSVTAPKKRKLDFLRPRVSDSPTPATAPPEVPADSPGVLHLPTSAASPFPVPSEGGSHRPTRDITLKNRHRPPADSGPNDSPRPTVTVNFTRRDASPDAPGSTGTVDRPMRTIKRPKRD